jgi:hypothetical protein
MTYGQCVTLLFVVVVGLICAVVGVVQDFRDDKADREARERGEKPPVRAFWF